MRPRRRSLYSARALATRREAALTSGTLRVEMEQATALLSRCPRWRPWRRRALAHHFEQLHHLWRAYLRGGEDTRRALVAIREGWHPSGLVLPGNHGRSR